MVYLSSKFTTSDIHGCVSWQVEMLYFAAYLVLLEFNMTVTNSVLRTA